MTIAAIAGKRVTNRLSGLDVQHLSPRDAEVELIVGAPEFVLVSGDSAKTNRDWAVPDNTPEFIELVSICRRRSIPLVLWLDSPILDLAVFRQSLWAFDLVAAVDVDDVNRLQQDHPDANVIFLPWFALPSVTSNPVVRVETPRPIGRSYLSPEILDTATSSVPSSRYSPALDTVLDGLTIAADSPSEEERKISEIEARDGLEERRDRLASVMATYSREAWLGAIRDATASPSRSAGKPPTEATGRLYTGEELFSEATAAGISLTTQDDGIIVAKNNSAGTVQLLSEPINADTLPRNINLVPWNWGIHAKFEVRFYDRDGDVQFEPLEGPPSDIAVPEAASTARFLITLPKGQSLTLYGIETSGAKLPDTPLALPESTLVLTPSFPSYSNLYQSAYVLSRLRSYRDQGLRSMVGIVKPNWKTVQYREFEGFPIATGSTQAFRAGLIETTPKRILVHRLTPDCIDVLRDIDSEIFVWIHGHEIQHDKHRSYLQNTSEKADAASRRSERLHTMWRELFLTSDDHWRFIFVSRYLAEQSFEDLGVRLPNHRWTVIPNPVDTDLFSYQEKHPNSRFNILSLRPYTSATQGNDLAAEAVLELSRRPGFDRYSFTFVGDGPQWHQILDPISHFDNVDLRNGFVRQQDIPDLHRQHGVFLVPTRMDSQGVSRSEAMSSGLVPVTNPIAAVPEFADSSCAMLAKPEDPVAIADAIEQLADEPDLFLRLSHAAAERSRQQVSAQKIIAEELAYLGLPSGNRYPEGDVLI